MVSTLPFPLLVMGTILSEFVVPTNYPAPPTPTISNGNVWFRNSLAYHSRRMIHTYILSCILVLLRHDKELPDLGNHSDHRDTNRNVHNSHNRV
jgi:hypothetical protein